MPTGNKTDRAISGTFTAAAQESDVLKLSGDFDLSLNFSATGEVRLMRRYKEKPWGVVEALTGSLEKSGSAVADDYEYKLVCVTAAGNIDFTVAM